MSAPQREPRLCLSLAVTLAALLGFGASPALAVTQSPQWTVTSVARPTNFALGDKDGEDAYKILVTNTGGAPSDGSAITITDELPAGLSLAPPGASGHNQLAAEENLSPGTGFDCSHRTCTYTGTVVPDQTLAISVPLDISATAPAMVSNVVRVSGGGAPDAAMVTPTTISMGPTPAGFGIALGGATSALSSTQAGAHPDITNSIAFNTVDSAGAQSEEFKDVTFNLPPGFAGDLLDTASCSAAAFLVNECPVGTQIGITAITLTGGLSGEFLKPVYNLAPNPGEVAKLGFVIAGNLSIEGGVAVRPGNYGLKTTFADSPAGILEINNVSLTIWGVPADPIHDPLRFQRAALSTEGHFGASSDAARAPFFTNPTSCGTEPLRSEFAVNSWQHPDQSVTEQMPFGPIVGCDRLSISPSIETQPTTTSAYSPTGLNADIEVPQTYDNPDGLATSNLRDAMVTLPEGMSLNPSAGSGLGDCTVAQFEYEASTAEPAPGLGCPNESKIGTVHVRSPALAEEATGSLFVAKPYENRFGSLLALYLVARIPNRGVVVATAGEVHSDPVTGQLTTTFDENPQLPFSDFTLAFRQGQTSPLITPPACGSYTANADLTPWSVPSQEHLLSSEFAITSGVHGGPCPGGGLPPFNPLLHAGSYSNRAGAYSPFYIRLSREDGEQEITHFSIKLPPGLVGKLAGIPFCSDAAIAAAKARTGQHGGQEEEESPSCPAASQIGRTEVEAGVGGTLASAPGKVYLAGPYHGSNLSVVAITAAKVGPFDLGTVVVREALKINPETAEVFVDSQGSDPLPHIVDGIPTHLRNIRIYMDRPEFVLNPTSCEPTSTASTVLGSGKNFVSEADDQPTTVTSFFQVANCAALGFKPKLKLSLKGGTKRGGTPAFKAVLTARKGDANIGEAQVTLPHSEFLEQAHIGTVCTRVQFKEGTVPGEKCPAASVYGRARAVTPILSEPLEGPVYLRSSSHNLPDLVAALNNKEINIDLDGHIDSVNGGRIRNTFEAVPDAPVSKFTLEMKGGKKGLLVNSTNICKSTNRVISHFVGQNGKVYDTKPVLSAKCGTKGKKASKHRSARK